MTEYTYNPKLAERPIRFIQRFCYNYTDRWAGKLFVLMDWQKELIRNLYGYVDAQGNRQYRQGWIEIAKGNGKSPLLAALGVYELTAADINNPEIYSIATDALQARITWEAGRQIIVNSPELFALVKSGAIKLKQYTIESVKNNGVWRVLAGTAEGRHGLRPSLVLYDEIHENGNHRGLYDAMLTNAAKRDNSLFICATNAGSSKHSLCWDLHREATEKKNPRLYSVIYTAPKELPIDDPATWKLANPGIGVTIAADAIAAEAERAKQSTHHANRFRRFFLSQWISDVGKWLNMDLWDSCTRPFALAEVGSAKLYVGIDLSLCDDISSVALCWLRQDGTLFVKFKNWIPKTTAEKYEMQNGTPFTEWQRSKHIRLLPSATIDDKTQRRIAKLILKYAAKSDCEVMYDRFKASRVVTTLERKEIPCVPVPQTFGTLGPACFHLERLLKEKTIVIHPNDCARWMASNAEIVNDNNGLCRPVKTGGNEAGNRGKSPAKIDAISALLDAITQVIRVQNTVSPVTAPAIIFI